MYLRAELELAKILAQKAGAYAMDMRTSLTVRHKPRGEGPVTNVDIDIDRMICQAILEKFPSDQVIGEESFSETSSKNYLGRTWFIDPIDGTTSYISGDDAFAVQIGLAIDGIPRLGVIFDPISDVLWSGVSGINQEVTKITKNNIKTLAVSRNHVSARIKNLITNLGHPQVLLKSSVGLKAMLVLDHKADMYVSYSSKIKLWDTCAPAAIIHSSGGIFEHVSGAKLNFLGPICHGEPILVANFVPGDLLREQIIANHR